MRSGSSWLLKLLVLSLGTVLAAPPVHAALISGQPARDLFELAVASAGYTKIEFTFAANAKLTTQIPGLELKTFQDPVGNPIDQPVNVSPMVARAGTIVGTPCGGCTDDGRYPYRIVFATPQQAAGIQRNWNQFSLTRFYAEDGSLLGSFTGTGYVGWVGETGQTATFVKRIEMDGLVSGGARQVGYSDDLIYGVGPVPEPGTLVLLGAGLAAIGVRRRHRNGR